MVFQLLCRTLNGSAGAAEPKIVLQNSFFFSEQGTKKIFCHFYFRCLYSSIELNVLIINMILFEVKDGLLFSKIGKY